MPYITQAELADRFGSDELIALADRDRDGVADAAVIDQAITDAEAEIDGYLAVRYTVPLISASAGIKTICADIARYRMMDDRPLDEAVKRYEAAVRFLRDVATGRASLGLTSPSDAQPFRYAASKGVSDRTMSHKTLEGY